MTRGIIIAIAIVCCVGCSGREAQRDRQLARYDIQCARVIAASPRGVQRERTKLECINGENALRAEWLAEDQRDDLNTTVAIGVGVTAGAAAGRK